MPITAFGFFTRKVIMKQGIKKHFKKHKTTYVVVGSCVLSAGITVLIMRSNTARGAVGEGIARGEITNTASLVFGQTNVVNLTTVVEREGRGHPGWPVRNLETKRIFFSQKEAADAFGVPENVLSGHINGKFPDVDGLHFERVNLQPTERGM